jgi:hypothetical protein
VLPPNPRRALIARIQRAAVPQRRQTEGGKSASNNIAEEPAPQDPATSEENAAPSSRVSSTSTVKRTRARRHSCAAKSFELAEKPAPVNSSDSGSDSGGPPVSREPGELRPLPPPQQSPRRAERTPRSPEQQQPPPPTTTTPPSLRRKEHALRPADDVDTVAAAAAATRARPLGPHLRG